MNLYFLGICAFYSSANPPFLLFFLYPCHPLAALLIYFHSVPAPNPKQLTTVVFLIPSLFPEIQAESDTACSAGFKTICILTIHVLITG